jgi:aminoglycoside 3'-phosphotransferase II
MILTAEVSRMVEQLGANAPPQWRTTLAGYEWLHQEGGQSGASVYRLEANGATTLFLKTGPASSAGQLKGEAERLIWLANNNIPCPKVLAQTEHGGRYWLLMGSVEGVDLDHSTALTARQVISIAASALRLLHALNITTCPFDARLEAKLASATKLVELGLVDEGDFDDSRADNSATDLLAETLASRPAMEDLVVTHGDATFSNLLSKHRRFTGFVDCGRLGVADRHQDLALMIRDIEHSYGGEYVSSFLHSYGQAADPKLIEFYQLLDEFF